MNNKAQAFGIRWMLGILLFLITIAYISPLKDTISLNRDSTHLDCGNTTISDGSKITCLFLDMSLWYFLGAMFLLAVGVLWEKNRSSG